MSQPLLNHYDPISFVHIHSEPAKRDQFDECWVIPSFSTMSELVEIEEGMENLVNIYSEDEKNWSLQPDFRGQVFYKKETGEMVIINQVGAVSDDLTDNPRPNELYKWDSKKNDWVIDKSLKQESITNQNTTKKMELKTTAEERIILLERKDKLKRATPEDLAMRDLLYGFTINLDDLDLTQENIVFPEMPS